MKKKTKIRAMVVCAAVGAAAFAANALSGYSTVWFLTYILCIILFIFFMVTLITGESPERGDAQGGDEARSERDGGKRG